MNDMAINIAVTLMRDKIPLDDPLADRVRFAMRYAKEHKHDLFWMVGNASDDLMLRTALASVMVTGNEDDKDMIKRSIMPLKMINAAAQGIPVNFEDIDDDILPIMKLWSEATDTSEVHPSAWQRLI